MNKKIIYDIGLHLGFDTKMYLQKGYKVIAIEANIDLVKSAEKTFLKEILLGDLKIVNCAISDIDNQKIQFYICDVNSGSSLNEEMAKRGGNTRVQEVKTSTLPSLFKNYGVPYYCKIDIEGYDHIAIKTLINHSELLPKYISAEINNLSDNGIISDLVQDENELFELWTSSLDTLKKLGYKKFKLVDQVSLEVWDKNSSYLNSKLYFKNNIITKLTNKFLRVKTCLKTFFTINIGYPSDCSGPFGDELANKWLEYNEAKESILHHVKKGLKFKKRRMWCDIHASL